VSASATATGPAPRTGSSGFPDFHADIKWQIVSDNMVTTYKIYHGTQTGPVLGVPPTGKAVAFETVDVMKVFDGHITDHWESGTC
jgi:predicted ester cyclase